jgi:hypothetical protein
MALPNRPGRPPLDPTSPSAKVRLSVSSKGYDRLYRAAADARVSVPELAALDREQARLTEAIAAGADMPVVIARLRDTERRRAELSVLETCKQPHWHDIERELRQSLVHWRSTLLGDVSQAREAFRRLLNGPIVFTPIVDRGYRAIRFEGRIGLKAIFGAEMVTGGRFMASPTIPSWNQIAEFLKTMQQLRDSPGFAA